MAEPITGSRSGLSGTVLVVDDSRMHRLTVARLLEQLGHRVVEAVDGRDGLDRLANGSPIDLVLLDLVMPVMDGFETLAAIRADPALASIPVIVISGLDDIDGVVRCIQMGAVDYLPRPIKPAILEARVGACLADKRLRDENARLLDTVRKQREELSRFVSPQVAALIGTPEGEQLLAGHRRAVTAVFADLRGYTAFAESAEPEELLDVLRGYHAAMGARIVEHGGTLEHFAGDGLHVWFNDPVEQPDHPLRAVRMALAMRDDVAGLAADWARRGYHLGFGVGIATGFATAGRIGYEGRYDYAAIGNAVVMAARLSGKAGGGQILASQRTFAAVEADVDAVPLDGLELKGMSHPVTAWSITALRA